MCAEGKKGVCHSACLWQIEEDHRHNVWRQTNSRVWLWRGESSHFLWMTFHDSFTCNVILFMAMALSFGV